MRKYNPSYDLFSIEHALTLNETAFDVALKFQQRNQNRHLSIDYLDNDNKIEFINDTKMTEQVLLDTYRIQLSPNVCRTKSSSLYFLTSSIYIKLELKRKVIEIFNARLSRSRDATVTVTGLNRSTGHRFTVPSV